jgi:hypothetical protein
MKPEACIVGNTCIAAVALMKDQLVSFRSKGIIARYASNRDTKSKILRGESRFCISSWVSGIGGHLRLHHAIIAFL